jgi:hypothetical protein
MASGAAHTPPVSVLFAAFLGYNPIEHLLGPHVLATVSAANRATLTGRSFFPHLISGPFRSGLHEAFLFAIIACLIAAAASLMRGGTYHHVERSAPDVGADADAVEANAARTNPEIFDQRAVALARPTTAEEQHAS